MFYSGWELLTPSFMSVSELSEELRHVNTSGDTAATYLTQDLLLSNGDDNHDVSATQQRPHHQPSTDAGVLSPASRGNGSDAVHFTPSSTSEVTETHTSVIPGRRHRQRPFDNAVREEGCVLHLAARTALSFKEMEQLLHRRATGSSDCFHVKSNAPAMAQAAVVFMECVAVGPSLQPGADTADATERNTNRDTAAASPKVSGGVGKPTLPALVLGVCQKSLKWYSLPGEAENSIGFYVAQRLIVKNGNEDGDAVKLPDDGRSGVGGSRVHFGDHVGCLIDLVRHQLVFTVNKDIVSTLPLDPSLADGSYYFAIGLARLPQQTTDVVVRFYSGAQCMNQGEPCGRGETTPQQLPPQRQRQPPVFPLESYVRELALQWVGRCTTFMSGQEGESHIRRSLTPPSSGDAAATVPHHREKEERHTTPTTNTCGASQLPLALETLRDTRVTAVLRDYLSVRGLSSTLEALDAELQNLSPAQSLLYMASANAAAGGSAGSSPTPSSTQFPSSPFSHVLWRPPMRGEAQEAWRRYAADMRLLRTLLLEGAARDASSAPSQTLSALLSQMTLWRPSLAYAFASVFERYVATAWGGVGIGGDHHKNGAAASVPLSPYDWVIRTIHPSLFALSMMALRQDIRYLVQSYQAVEELWGILQSYLASARAACQMKCPGHSDHLFPPQQSSSAPGGDKEKLQTVGATHGRCRKPSGANETASFQTTEEICSDQYSPNTSSASLAPTPEAERQVQAAFTSFFTQLVWNPTRVLPSPMTHIRRASSLSSAGANVSDRSGDALGSAPLEALATLAGRAGAKGDRFPPKTNPDQHRSRSCLPLDTNRDLEDFRACAAACAASVRRGSVAAGGDHGHDTPGRHRPSPSQPSHPLQRPLYAAHVEEAILVLYRAAVVPAPAPARSTQVCLLQTLSSLHTHTVSTLRQMERFPWANGRSGTVGFANRTALDSIDLLEALLRTVQDRYRQQVWRRLVHAVEDVNQQLEEQLRHWSVLAGKAEKIVVTPFVLSVVRTLPQVKTGLLRRSGRSFRCPKGQSHAKDGDFSRSDAAALEDGGTARHRSSVKERTSVVSLHGGMSKAEEDDKKDSALSAEVAQSMSAVPSYESLTTFMPSLRLLWRRVAARAALEPSLHLVTELFVQELRRSLDLTPALGWHQRASTEPSAASATGLSSEGVSAEGGISCAAAMRPSPSVVTVKRPLSMASGHSSVSSDTLNTAPPTAPGAPDRCEGKRGSEDEAAEAAVRWFAEELYLSSMYMKRVFKHMSGS